MTEATLGTRTRRDDRKRYLRPAQTRDGACKWCQPRADSCHGCQLASCQLRSQAVSVKRQAHITQQAVAARGGRRVAARTRRVTAAWRHGRHPARSLGGNHKSGRRRPVRPSTATWHRKQSVAPQGGRAIPCNLRREGGQSLVILEGWEGNPL